MPIDVSAKGSPGWWFKQLSGQMYGKPAGGVSRAARLQSLRDRYEGNPPLPEGAEQHRDAYRRFQKKARINYAEMIAEAVRERQKLLAFRTAAAGDDNGDAEAAATWAANDMDVEFSEVLEFMVSMGDGYTIVGPPQDGEIRSVITAEDPRQVITAHDPIRQSRVRAALKLFHDDEDDVDRAYVYLPGATRNDQAQVWKAVRPGRSSVISPAFKLSPRAWDWDDEPVKLATDRVPVVRYRNRRGVAEFEPHIDDLDRINHMVLQRLVIATLQAFRQRAAKGAPTHYPKGHPLEGQPVDYTDIFTADPGALWLLPAGVELWESGVIDLTPILSSVKDDVRELMAVSRTPFYMVSPDSTNGSAAGASLQREGLVFKVEDRNVRAGAAAAMTMSLAFELQGDRERAELGALKPIWADVERFSLAERYDAAVKARTAGVPRRAIWTNVLQATPAQIAQWEGWAADDALLGADLPPVTDDRTSA